MTLRADLAALLADAEILDVDIEEAVEDEHVRSHVYRKIISVAAASQRRDGDRALVATILRDPIELVSKTAVVHFVDTIAMKAADAAEFQQWAAGISPETQLLKAKGSRRFVQRRIQDWTMYLEIKAGRKPTDAELTNATDWMQRLIATESTSLPILTLLAEKGRTSKIRRIAKNRARSRAIKMHSLDDVPDERSVR
ncbi:hypothetical protein [Actinomadura rudentiformis]|uniref:Uncharacterized protein n=1 Tax=Actinomadura rudentiformis TaxID=359158 RepID=A0A6H9Z367_9ACTN|nr:hypothetical protein [Actinomadura rudentiformis]KAB2352522.1 hypothetical protein F8566_02245 [Actinomadura rudentiformis]